MLDISKAIRGQRSKWGKTEQDVIAFAGGLNLVDSELAISPGQCLSAINYEMGVDGGYERIKGYQRFDGTLVGLPTYWHMPWKSEDVPLPYPQVGDVVVGADSGADGTILAFTDNGQLSIENKNIWSEDFENAHYTPLKYMTLDSDTASNALSYPTKFGDTIVLNAMQDNAVSDQGNSYNGFETPDDYFTADSVGQYWQIDFWCAHDARVVNNNPSAFFSGLEIVTTGGEVTFENAAGSGAGALQVRVANFREQSEYNDGRSAIWDTGNADVSAVYDSTDVPATDVFPAVHVTLTFRVASISGGGQFGIKFYQGAVRTGGSEPSWYWDYDDNNLDNYHYLMGGLQVQKDLAGGYSSPPEASTYVKTEGATASYYTGDLIFGDTGAFQVGEALEIGAVDTGMTSNGTNDQEGESDPALHAYYMSLGSAADVSSIGAVPGSGPPRGLWFYNDNLYAFRDSTDGLTGKMYQSTSGGWLEIIPNTILYFDTGVGTAQQPPLPGTRIEGGTSSADAYVERVVTTSGAWGVDAAGYFVVSDVNGTWATGEDINLYGTATTIADVDGSVATEAPTLQPGGKYRFRNYNFSGHTDRYSMYGVSGVDKAFEFTDQGEQSSYVFTQITTGMTTDTPEHIGVHKLHLWLGFSGGSSQHSSLADPLAWKVITGAEEMAVGDEITGYLEEMAGTLFIFTRNQAYFLAGDSAANFKIEKFNQRAGARADSIGWIGGGIFFDDQGFATLQSTDRFGNYVDNSISEKIQPVIDRLVQGEVGVKGSMVLRRKNRYRCFFDDGTIISVGFKDKKVSGLMMLEMPIVPECIVCEESRAGLERAFFADTDGWIYEMETGNSFDGAEMSYHIRLPYVHNKSPMTFKKYAQARLDCLIGSSVSLSAQWEYNLSDPNYSKTGLIALPSTAGGGNWDSFTWDNFTWDKPVQGMIHLKMEGEGVNFGLLLTGTTASDPPHTLRGLATTFRQRRQDRRT